MSPPTRNRRNPRLPAPYDPPPRQALIDPKDKSYNRVIRLEGQIATRIQIQRFLWRYDVCNKDYFIDPAAEPAIPTHVSKAPHHRQTFSITNDAPLQDFEERRHRLTTDTLLNASRLSYFDVIEELIDTFLNRGVDLAYEGHNLDDFVAMIKARYLRSLTKAAREKEGLWAKIWWFQHLQEILEDENLSVNEALVKGWHWFIDVEEWPAEAYGRSAYAEMWKEVDHARQQRFLEEFTIDEEKIKTWISGLSVRGFCCENAVGEEGQGLLREFAAAGVDLVGELDVPKLAEDAVENGSTCSLCGEGYSMEWCGTDASHAPVCITPCGHVFCWHCIYSRSRNDIVDGECTLCKVRFSAYASPQDLIDGCDKILRWLQPPLQVQTLTESDSYLKKLMLILEPTDDIRRRLKFWVPHLDGLVADMNKLGDLGIYQARERMAAVVAKDVTRYREALKTQAQATAQRLWLEFLSNILPFY